MKKSLFIVAAFVAVSFASCKKDHTCTCTSSDSWGTSVSTMKAKSTKKAGTAWCSAGNSVSSTYTPTGGGGSTTTTTTQTCVLS